MNVVRHAEFYRTIEHERSLFFNATFCLLQASSGMHYTVEENMATFNYVVQWAMIAQYGITVFDQ